MSFSYEKMGTKTRFEEEAKRNSEMAYLQSNSPGKVIEGQAKCSYKLVGVYCSPLPPNSDLVRSYFPQNLKRENGSFFVLEDGHFRYW